MDWETLAPIALFLLPAFGAAVNIGYFLLSLSLIRGLGKLSVAPVIEAPESSLTVLVAARNEEANIRACLDSLMSQSYQGPWKVVVVDDRSEDKTPVILSEYVTRFPDKLTVLRIEPDEPSSLSPKKHALQKGIAAATGEWIVTTDADCTMGPHWLEGMASFFSPEVGFVQGQTSYNAEAGVSDFFWGVQSLEFLSYTIVSASLIGLRFPVSANANNIAYRREALEASRGIIRHAKIVSGDDDFLLQAVHRLGRWKLGFALRPESQVRTRPCRHFSQIWEQRKRWASKCIYYGWRQVLFLSLIFAYYASIFLGIVLGWLYWPVFVWALLSLLVKTGGDWMVMTRGTRMLQKSGLMRWFWPTAAVHIPLILGAVVAGTLGRFTWKGQQVKRKIN